MKNLLQILKKQRPKIQEDPNPLQNPSPNLLNYKYSDTNLIASKKDAINKYLKYPIYILQFSFLLLILLNFIINKQLSAAEQRVKAAENELLSQSQIYERSRTINRQIETYKNIETTRLEFYKRTELLLSEIPSNVQVTSIKLGSAQSSVFGMTISFEVDDALGVALLINRFLNIEDVEQVILNSATRGGGSRGFEVEMTIEMR